MTQYIDKAAVVAEIERQQRKLCLLSQLDNVELRRDAAIQNGVYYSFLSFINTLEVKEVDLEKEIGTYISDNFFGSQTLGFFSNRTKEEPNDRDIVLCAKHFFELGLKMQKGE